jgi:hypothetical protein
MFPQARGGAQRSRQGRRFGARQFLTLSSGGVVVIERQVEVLRTVAGLWRAGPRPALLDQNPRSMGSLAALEAVMPAVGVDRAVCDPLTWWPSDACDYCVVGPSKVGGDPGGFEVLRGGTSQ